MDMENKKTTWEDVKNRLKAPKFSLYDSLFMFFQGIMMGIVLVFFFNIFNF